MTELNELVELNENELDCVNGGTASEFADDSRFLNSLAGYTNRYSEAKFRVGLASPQKIKDGWANVGVELRHSDTGGLFSNGAPNEYYINGKQVSQEEARQHAMKVTGHHMERSEWDW